MRENNTKRNNELYHYGVLGMKWDVHRGNSAKALTKASKKLAKYEKKADKYEAKKYKYASKRRTESNVEAARNFSRKELQMKTKAISWYKKVEKTLGSEAATSMTNSYGVNIGRKYADSNQMTMMMNSISMASMM